MCPISIVLYCFHSDTVYVLCVLTTTTSPASSPTTSLGPEAAVSTPPGDEISTRCPLTPTPIWGFTAHVGGRAPSRVHTWVSPLFLRVDSICRLFLSSWSVSTWITGHGSKHPVLFISMPGPAQPTTVPWEKREALVAAEEGEVVSWSTKLHLCSSVGCRGR